MKKFHIGVILLLAAVIVLQLLYPPGPPAMEKAAGTPAGDEESMELLSSIDYVLGFAPSEVYPQITQRPVFFKDRRPPAEVEVREEKPAPAKVGGHAPTLTLKGVVGVGSERFALVSLGNKKAVQRLKLGEEIAGWRVSEIHHDRLVLVGGTEKQDVLLRSYKPFVPSRAPAKPATVNRVGKKILSRSPAGNERMPAKRGNLSRKVQNAQSSAAGKP